MDLMGQLTLPFSLASYPGTCSNQPELQGNAPSLYTNGKQCLPRAGEFVKSRFARQSILHGGQPTWTRASLTTRPLCAQLCAETWYLLIPLTHTLTYVGSVFIQKLRLREVPDLGQGQS